MNPSIPRPIHMNGFHQQNFASSSSNPYPEFPDVNINQYPNSFSIHQQHIPQQQPSHPLPQSQWSAPMRNNSHHIHHRQPPQHPLPQRHQPQHQQPQREDFNPPMFSNGPPQMSAPSYPSGNPSIGGFNLNMPFISQQIIQDAFAMSAPVVAADEKILLQALIDSRNKKETYKDALNALHGKNGHSASLWKDYYLEHKDRLDDWIAAYLNPPRVSLQTVKKPSANFKTEHSPVLPSRGLPKQTKRSERSVQPSQPLKGRRSTINSLSAPEPVYDDRLPAPNAELRVPEPPSRSPSPPTTIIPQGRGNKYTPEDREFFLKFISWRLVRDPTLNRNDLCAQLAEKAPHHTVQSWGSYWSNHHDLPDKILAAARGEEDEGDDDSKSDREIVPSRRRPKYHESSSEEDEDEDEDGDGEDAEEESDDDASIQSFSESEMGQRGGSFTDADLYVTAYYVATFPAFDETSAKERWQPYSERFPQRSAKSWTEYYRRYERQINKLAKKIRARKNDDQEATSLIRTQRARPAWASSSTANYPKRKHDAEDEEAASPSKRGREAVDA